MRPFAKRIKLTFFFSLVSGILFLLVLNTTTVHYPLQNGLLCFLIGFSIIWLVYLSIWFVANGFKKTAFPKQSTAIVDWIATQLKSGMTPYQKKTNIEITGTIIMILMGLGLAALALFIVSGLMYTVGKFFW